MLKRSNYYEGCAVTLPVGTPKLNRSGCLFSVCTGYEPPRKSKAELCAVVYYGFDGTNEIRSSKLVSGFISSFFVFLFDFFF